MEGFELFVAIIGLLLWVMMLLSFFGMAADLKRVLAEAAHQTRYLEAISVNMAKLVAGRSSNSSTPGTK